jgi:hypothetical protein
MNEPEIGADDVRREHARDATPVSHGLYLAAVVGGASLLMLVLLTLFQAT